MVCRHYDWKVNALIKVNAIRKGILITDHNYENVIAN
jgi:hypothetical protein